MKPRLTVTLLLLSSFTFNPDLLKQLQVLLARLAEVLAAQTRTTIIYRSPPVPPPTMSRVTLDIAVSPPEISEVTPRRGGVGTLITNKGRGFATSGNAVYTSYDVIDGLPSPDGQTMILKVVPPGLPANLGALKTPDFPELRFRFYVKNQNGTTPTPGEFVLDL